MSDPATPLSPRDKGTRLPRYAADGSYLLLAIVTLAWGAWKRFHIPQAPMVDPDIRGYLGPALLALLGKGFIHMDGRSFPYPAFVYLVLRVFGDFRAIGAVQHLLGVAAGALILLAWNAMLRLVPPGGIPRELARYIGLAPATIYLGSATAIYFEQQIRPEALFPFLSILNIFIGFLFIDRRFIRRQSSAIWLGGMNVFVACLIYLLKPSFGLATLFSTAPVWASLICKGASRGQKGVLAAAAILPAGLLLLLPEHLLKQDDAWSRLFLPETLFSVHASIILDQMSRDLATNAQTPYRRGVIQSAHDLLAADLKKEADVPSSKAFPSLGYNPDYLMYDSFCLEFPKLTNWNTDQLAAFYQYEYRRAALQQPSATLRKITGQMRLFYCSKVPAYRLGQTMDVADDYARTPDLIARKIPIGGKYPPLTAYYHECTNLAAKGATIEQPRRLTEWTRFLSAHYPDLLVVALLSPLLLIFQPLRGHLFWAVVSLWLVYSYNFGNCLTIAIVHSLEVIRYVRIQLIFTVFAQCLSIYFLLEAIIYSVRLLLGRRVSRASQ
jgi:hypothetical protein